MKDSIRLHKEHGLNPTMPVCIICGEDTGEIALLGASYKGEAPSRMVIGVEPCKVCREKYLTKGTLLVEVDGERKPTGTLTVLKDGAFERVTEQKPPKQKIVMVEVGIIQRLNNEKN